MKELPVVLIHGYPLDHTMWFSTIAALGSQARVICPDLPGFGREPVLEVDPSMGAYAGWLRKFLETQGVTSAVLAGMSMGGYVALAFAELFPEAVAGLALISTQSAADSPDARTARHEMIGRIKDKGTGVAAEAIVAKMFPGKSSGNPDLANYVREGAARAGTAGLTWALQAMAGRKDQTEMVENLRVPVLVLHGAEDKIVPLASARRLAENCKLPIMVELKEVGHGSPLEAPDAVAQALVGLLGTVRESRAVQAKLTAAQSSPKA